MSAIQLELDFKSAITQALDEPEVADLNLLWRSFESELVGLTEKEQLQVAGQALCDLAQVCQLRAEMMWDEWVDQHNTNGPIPDEDFLAGLVQKTMFLDISSLVRQPKARKKGAVVDEGESVVAEVTKETALLLAGAELEPADVMEGLEYDENVGEWAEAIRGWMQQKGGDQVGFMELLDGVGFEVVKGWLAVLLGGFDMQQGAGFYEGAGILVGLKQDESAEALGGAIALLY